MKYYTIFICRWSGITQNPDKKQYLVDARLLNDFSNDMEMYLENVS